jgi:hypothetical protein
VTVHAFKWIDADGSLETVGEGSGDTPFVLFGTGVEFSLVVGDNATITRSQPIAGTGDPSEDFASFEVVINGESTQVSLTEAPMDGFALLDVDCFVFQGSDPPEELEGDTVSFEINSSMTDVTCQFTNTAVAASPALPSPAAVTASPAMAAVTLPPTWTASREGGTSPIGILAVVLSLAGVSAALGALSWRRHSGSDGRDDTGAGGASLSGF